jgi:hypothetical protein
MQQKIKRVNRLGRVQIVTREYTNTESKRDRERQRSREEEE